MNNKTLITIFVAFACVVAVIAIVALSSPSSPSSTSPPFEYEEPLYFTCDYLLCEGIDFNGNEYQLVANQTESSMGYEITVGVIKNNEWVYPLSSDFPFLAEDGLFHVPTIWEQDTGISLKDPSIVSNHIYFLDSGAFLMEFYQNEAYSTKSPKKEYIIFSCDTLESYRLDREIYHLKYVYYDGDYDKHFFNEISTDNGKMILYATSKKTGDWYDGFEYYYNWYVLDVQTLKMTKIASDVYELTPCAPLSEGLFFVDNLYGNGVGFYNTSAQKVIDISHYRIISDTGRIRFKNGKCSFEVKNPLGTKFEITIDTKGNVLSETSVN